MEDPGGSIMPELILIGILIFVNAIFAAAEMAVVASNKSRMETLAEEGNNRAKRILTMSLDQTRFLSTIQVGVALSRFFSAAIVTIGLLPALSRKLNEWSVPYDMAVALLITVLVLSFVMMVIGELIPKRVALQTPDKIALVLINFVVIFSKLLKPFVWLLNAVSILVLKMIGKYSEDVEEKISEEELKSYLQVGQQQGVINESGQEMMVNIMAFDDKLAYEVMTPRTSLYMIDYDEFNIEKVEEMLAEGYSRAPVYKETADDIIGTIYIKDVFVEYAKSGYAGIKLDEIIKKPYFVPETKKIDQLLKDLKATKNYMAILIDEYGGLSGIVTMEDIVEEIVGDIEDEYDDDEDTIVKLVDGTYIVDASMYIDDVNKELNLKIYSDNNETISGLVIDKLGFIPEEGSKENHEINLYDNVFAFTLGVKDKRIDKIRLVIKEDESKCNSETINKY
ncbi:MAG: hemolysin family protein [Eubacteriales bacterium]|nr:hemolysin family protein [Eubacteriales bacterium]MDY3332278.1 hemolysin family protein [Gallibacter sp.]